MHKLFYFYTFHNSKLEGLVLGSDLSKNVPICDCLGAIKTCSATETVSAWVCIHSALWFTISSVKKSHFPSCPVMHCLHPLLLLIRHQTHNISSMFNTPHVNPSLSKPHWNPSKTPGVRRSSEIKRRLKKRNLPFALSFCFLTLTLHLKCHWSSKGPPKKTTAAAITLLLLINIHFAVVLLSLLRCASETGSMYVFYVLLLCQRIFFEKQLKFYLLE